MKSFQSGTAKISVEQREPESAGTHPAMILLHGSMGAGSYWLGRFAPVFAQQGIAVFAPRYLQKTGTLLATSKTIFDGKHFPAWLTAVRDAVSYVAERPNVDARRIGIVGFSLGAYLAMAAAIEDRRIRAVIELAGGVPQGWENQIAASMAPTLILHGGKDRVVQVTEAYKAEELLKSRGVPYELEVFPGEPHWAPGATQAIRSRCAEFLRKHL